MAHSGIVVGEPVKERRDCVPHSICKGLKRKKKKSKPRKGIRELNDGYNLFDLSFSIPRNPPFDSRVNKLEKRLYMALV